MINCNVLQKRLISQKYKKNSPGKYALLLYLAISIRWISKMFDADIHSYIFQPQCIIRLFGLLGESQSLFTHDYKNPWLS